MRRRWVNAAVSAPPAPPLLLASGPSMAPMLRKRTLLRFADLLRANRDELALLGNPGHRQAHQRRPRGGRGRRGVLRAVVCRNSRQNRRQWPRCQQSAGHRHRAAGRGGRRGAVELSLLMASWKFARRWPLATR